MGLPAMDTKSKKKKKQAIELESVTQLVSRVYEKNPKVAAVVSTY